eukprot:6085779-Pleurochrysis_carterae.AAC.1
MRGAHCACCPACLSQPSTAHCMADDESEFDPSLCLPLCFALMCSQRLLLEMPKVGLSPGVFAYCSAIAAASKVRRRSRRARSGAKAGLRSLTACSLVLLSLLTRLRPPPPPRVIRDTQ